jgi:hypothetical protein
MVLLETYSIVKEQRVLRRELSRARYQTFLPPAPGAPRRAVSPGGGAERD